MQFRQMDKIELSRCVRGTIALVMAEGQRLRPARICRVEDDLIVWHCQINDDKRERYEAEQSFTLP